MGLMPVVPPGFTFCPSDEELFRYYLPVGTVRESYFEYGSGGMMRHWYFDTAVRGPAERQRRMRAVNGGFWLMRGRGNHAVVGGGGEVLGTKSCFVFYMGNSIQNAAGTDWTLHEFALPDRAQASFVLYRLFVKPRTENSSSSARNDRVLTYEAAPGGNSEDVTTGHAVNHHHGDSDGGGNFDADFAAPLATGAPRVDYK
ncbi:protein CUP-SHAPED COTYLEDON 3-like [Syzygium oleosum]|uniref:protein CUP-SHAPED COTYLEDON 3-like n=1 Tax=Syzygium oleosum TaxID=219896 RepID=UPI0024B92E90|nr:protein CUP-SHAPED COTYLEDON 3-like [Syzygium oleosum]